MIREEEMANAPTAGSAAPAPKAKGGKRAPRSVEKVLADANRAVERSTNAIVQLHLKSNNMAGVQAILDARKALSASLVAPTVTAE